MSELISVEEVARLRALERAATRGPWRWESEGASVVALYGPKGQFDHVLWSQRCKACQQSMNRCTTPSQADADLIAEARNTIVKLLDAASMAHALRAEIEAGRRYRRAVDAMRENFAGAVDEADEALAAWDAARKAGEKEDA